MSKTLKPPIRHASLECPWQTIWLECSKKKKAIMGNLTAQKNPFWNKTKNGTVGSGVLYFLCIYTWMHTPYKQYWLHGRGGCVVARDTWLVSIVCTGSCFIDDLVGPACQTFSCFSPHPPSHGSCRFWKPGKAVSPKWLVWTLNLGFEIAYHGLSFYLRIWYGLLFYNILCVSFCKRGINYYITAVCVPNVLAKHIAS